MNALEFILIWFFIIFALSIIIGEIKYQHDNRNKKD